MNSPIPTRYGIDPECLYNALETAQKLRESKPTLARHRALGSGPAYIKKRGQVLYPGFSLIAYLDAHLVDFTTDAQTGN